MMTASFQVSNSKFSLYKYPPIRSYITYVIEKAYLNKDIIQVTLKKVRGEYVD
jgi:hypothetical protein